MCDVYVKNSLVNMQSECQGNYQYFFRYLSHLFIINSSYYIIYMNPKAIFLMEAFFMNLCEKKKFGRFIVSKGFAGKLHHLVLVHNSHVFPRLSIIAF